DAVRDPAALQLDVVDVDVVVLARRQHGHGEAVIAGRALAIALERLLPRGNTEHAIPLHFAARVENRLEMAAMEGIEGSAADGYVHTTRCHPERSAGSRARTAGDSAPSSRLGMTRFSRTILASIRTSSRTCSPVTAE